MLCTSYLLLEVQMVGKIYVGKTQNGLKRSYNIAIAVSYLKTA